MGLLDLEERRDDESWDGYPTWAWDKPSRAVIVQGPGKKSGCVLYAAGPHIRMMMEDGQDLESLGLDDAPEGISIWEGVTGGGNYSHGMGDYCDLYLTGKFRDPTQNEWDYIKSKLSPWSDEFWRKERMKDY